MRASRVFRISVKEKPSGRSRFSTSRDPATHLAAEASPRALSDALLELTLGFYRRFFGKLTGLFGTKNRKTSTGDLGLRRHSQLS